MTETRNAELYRQMSEPHESRQVADERLDAFMTDIYALREKHCICDVLVVVGDNYRDGETECSFITSMTVGDWMRSEPLAAYALGKARAEREAMIGNLVGGKPK